jgi:hypothetical protein
MGDDPIDPRLQQYAQSLPPHTLAQAYTAGPALANSAGHQPYYLPTPIHTHHQHPHANLNAHARPPPLAPAAPPSALDPALEPSPTDHQVTSPDDEDDDQEGDHDGYVAAYCAPITPYTDGGSAHATPGSAKSPGDLKRPRACDSCRGLKVRLEFEDKRTVR